MSEENKTIVRRIVEEFYNDGNEEVADELFADDFVGPATRRGDAPAGPEERKQSMQAIRTAFPPAQLTIEDLFAEGDKVALRWTGVGKDTHEFMGVAPTGKQTNFNGTWIFRISNGKVVELFANSDMLGLMQQLGIVPNQ